MNPLIPRLRRTLTSRALLGPGDHALVAVSGGADSVALLRLLDRLRGEFSLTLTVAHLDHGLRGAESAADALWVEALARSLGLGVIVARADAARTAREEGVSVEMAARDLRYRFLVEAARRAGAGTVATAHTADDLAETVLLFMSRGAGSSGLRGFAWRRPLAEGIILVRPLRETSRAELEAFLREEGVTWRHDRTNDDPAHLRNRIRGRVMPVLREELNPRIVAALGRAADRWREADEFIEESVRAALADTLVSSTRGPRGEVALRAGALERYHPTLHGRVLSAAFAALSSRLLGETHVAALARLAGGTGGAVDLPGGFRARRQGDHIVIRAAAFESRGAGDGAEYPPLPLRIPGLTPLPGTKSSPESFLHAILEEDGTGPLPPWRGPRNRAVLDWHALRPPLEIRHPRPGDRIRPLGLGGSRKLHDILVDRKVPREDRPGVWVIGDQERIVWVVGIVMSEEARVTGLTTRRLVLEESRA